MLIEEFKVLIGSRVCALNGPSKYISERGSRSNYCCGWLHSSSTSVGAWIGKPAVLKWTLVPFTNIVKCTAH